MSRNSAAAQIVERNQERHSHNPGQDRCKRCGAYVSKGDPENGAYRYQCNGCGHWVLEYTAGEKATAD